MRRVNLEIVIEVAVDLPDDGDIEQFVDGSPITMESDIGEIKTVEVQDYVILDDGEEL